jgi:hypothetical protein
MRCPKCGSEESGAFCSRCGADLGREGPACASCGAGIELDALFCAECGAPTGRRPAKPHLAYLPWALSGLALVAFAVAIAFFVQAQTQPRIGDMPVTGGLPEAPREEAGGAGTQGAGTGMVDLSQLSSRQAADRLFERAMRTDEEGDAERAKFFANMAVQAYSAVPPEEIDADARFHVGLLHLLQGEPGAAAAEASSILSARPAHLLGLALAARAAGERGYAAAEREAYERFLDALPTEREAGLPEYRMHDSLIETEAARARESTGRS